MGNLIHRAPVIAKTTRRKKELSQWPDHPIDPAIDISPRAAHYAHLSALATAAEKLIAPIGFQPRHHGARRQIELFQYVAGLRIDPLQGALIAFPGAVPEFSVEPGNPSDEAIGFDGAQQCSGLRIDLMNFAVPILAH